MDKNKMYCPMCNKELVKINNNYEYQCNCYKNKKFDYTLQWCEDCQKFTSRRGKTKNSKCCRCAVRLQHKTMKETDPEGYAKRQAAATIKANEKMKAEGKGVWSKEQHILAEETKRKNGTDLGNKEFRERIKCNGNSQEVIDKQKELKIGIFSDKCLKLKTERFNNYWKDVEWIKADLERKQEMWNFIYNIECSSKCAGLNHKCNKDCLKNKYGVCEEKHITELTKGTNFNFYTIKSTGHRWFNFRKEHRWILVDDLIKLLEEGVDVSNYIYKNNKDNQWYYGDINILTNDIKSKNKNISKNYIKFKQYKDKLVTHKIKIEKLKRRIIGFDEIINQTQEKGRINGVYCWLLEGVPFYIGESKNILNRQNNHILHMILDPEYWCYILDNDIKIEIKILKSLDIQANKSERKYWETEMIDKFKPLSQKCNGTDYIKDLYDREYPEIILNKMNNDYS